MDEGIERKIGARVAEYRRAAGLTQEKLAEKVRVTPGTISRLERGISAPSLKALAQIAEVLQVALPELFNIQKDKSPKDVALEKLLFALKQLSEEELTLVHQLMEKVLQHLGRPQN